MADRSDVDKLVAGRRAAGRAESRNSHAGDPRLRQLQMGLGNDAMRAQMHQGHEDRGTMLMHVVDRLGVVEELQTRELRLLDRGATHEWWRAVARDETAEVKVPDPNHWHEVARTYKEACEALCHGDLGRGHHLLDRAMKLEDREVDQMSELVDLTGVDFESRPDSSALDALVSVGQLDPCDPPAGIEAADRILSVEVDIHKNPDLQRYEWWEEEEEEEEAGEPEGDDAGGG